MAGVPVTGLPVSGAAVAGVPVSRSVVVGAAIVRAGLLLAARRARPAELAGRWELPGGQAEPGEAERDALRRECREELGAEVHVLRRLGPELDLGTRRVLRVHLVALSAGSPEPRPLEHSELRWIGSAELPGLDWLDADRVLLPELAVALRERVIG